MMHKISKWPLLIGALTLLTGCLSLNEKVSVAEPDLQTDRYELTEARARSATGCQYKYRIYEPRFPITGTTVVVGHGFLRDQDKMVNLSRTLANDGIRVATLDFCNMHFWDGGHEDNARDMQDLAHQISADSDVIYAGFSAGALAAVLAADDQTRAIVTLDLVDQNDLGLDAVAQLQTPLIGFSGPPSKCNANNNAAALYDERSKAFISALTQLPDASHCDFESPSDWLCELACGDKDDSQSAQQTREQIIQAVAFGIQPYLSKTEKPETPLRQSAL